MDKIQITEDEFDDITCLYVPRLKTAGDFLYGFDPDHYHSSRKLFLEEIGKEIMELASAIKRIMVRAEKNAKGVAS